MKKLFQSILALSLVILSSNVFTQDLQVFRATEHYYETQQEEHKLVLISLSEAENWNHQTEKYTNQAEHARSFLLTESETDSHLTSIGISKEDTIFVNLLHNNRLLKIPVTDALPLQAVVSGYVDNDYHVGLLLREDFLDEDMDVYRGNIACIGRENPFTEDQLETVIWRKIDSDQFPSTKSEFVDNGDTLRVTTSDAYFFEAYGLKYYLRTCQTNHPRRASHIIVKNDQVVYEELLVDKEGIELDEITIMNPDGTIDGPHLQKTGQIFKNQPPVLMGLFSHWFGCQSIRFLSKNVSPIRIRCDNRH